jgi:hypothetical protein
MDDLGVNHGFDVDSNSEFYMPVLCTDVANSPTHVLNSTFDLANFDSQEGDHHRPLRCDDGSELYIPDPCNDVATSSNHNNCSSLGVVIVDDEGTDNHRINFIFFVHLGLFIILFFSCT